MPEFYQLEELVAFEDHGTISKAAEAVGVSQPAMSRSMKLLEDELGVPIFIRTSNTIQLNDTGRLAASYARQIVSSLHRAIEDVRAYDRSQKTILVGSVAPAPLWSVLSMLSGFHADKTIAGEMKDVKILVDGLKGGTYKYVITTAPLKIPGFTCLRLGEEKLCFVLPKKHPLASRRSLSFADLDGENMLLYENIGFWKGLPERMMPNSKFFIQSDRVAFDELVRKSLLPSFSSDLTSQEVEWKKAIPISDKEAQVTFYVSSRSSEFETLSKLSRNFMATFRTGQFVTI